MDGAVVVCYVASSAYGLVLTVLIFIEQYAFLSFDHQLYILESSLVIFEFIIE